MAEFLAIGEACKAIFCPTPGLREGEHLIALDFQQKGSSFLRLLLYHTAGKMNLSMAEL